MHVYVHEHMQGTTLLILKQVDTIPVHTCSGPPIMLLISHLTHPGEKATLLPPQGVGIMEEAGQVERGGAAAGLCLCSREPCVGIQAENRERS